MMQPSPEMYPWLSAGVIAWGLLDCFFGFRIFKIMLAVIGGLAGVVAGQAAGVALGLGQAGAIAGMITGGLLGAGLAYLLYLAAVFVSGFGFGLALGILLLSHFNHMVALLGGVVLGLVGGFLAVKLQRVLIILSTGLLGAFRTIVALSYFTSRMDWAFYLRKPEQIPALIENNTWMFPSILALAVVGVIAQFELGGTGGAKKEKKSKAKDE